jgi:anti-anti-sigma factor
MELQQFTQGALTVIKPAGALVEADCDQFRTMAMDLARKTRGRLVVDASAIAYLDSRGIESLVDVTEHMLDGGRALKLCGANATVRQVLDITGWANSFEYFDDLNAAARSFL